jgi:hypothetical protein
MCTAFKIAIKISINNASACNAIIAMSNHKSQTKIHYRTVSALLAKAFCRQHKLTDFAAASV